MFKNVMKPADFIAIGSIILAAFILFAAFFGVRSARSEDNELYCEVNCDGEIRRYSMLEDALIEFYSGGYRLTVEIREMEASVVSSDCPDKICVGSGTLRRPGDIAVCIPARVTVTVKGGVRDVDDVDFIAG